MSLFGFIFLMVLIVILINLFAKKIASFYLDSEIETKLWDFERYGYRAHWYLKKPFPIGVFLPIVVTAITLGALSKIVLTWMATLTFEIKPKTYRAAKRHGIYSFTEMTELHIGFVAAAGIFANLVFSVIGYLLGFPDFARLNIYYAFFNMIPISDLDGSKIFFGNFVMWCFLAALTLIGMAYALLLV